MMALLLSACSAELRVEKDGTGDGSVVSDPAGIDCGTTCSATFDRGSVVTLSASPDAGSYLNHWEGCDTYPGLGCEVNLGGPRVVIPVFSQQGTSGQVLVSVAGEGIVTYLANGSSCDATCAIEPVAEGNMDLVAYPGKGTRFGSWGGACDGSDPNDCSVAPDVGVSVSATFVNSAASQLYPSAMTAVSCAAPCSQGYKTTVRLANLDQAFRGLEFEVTAPTLALVGVTLAGGPIASCFAAAGASKVVIACPDVSLTNGAVATLTFESEDDADGFVLVDSVFGVVASGDDPAKVPVDGGAVILRGGP